MINIHHMLHCLMPRQYVELNFRLDLGWLLSLTNTQQRQKGSLGTSNRKGTDFSCSLLCPTVPQLSRSPPHLSSLAVLKISNTRALGKQGPTYQAGISIVKCTALRASKETLFI